MFIVSKDKRSTCSTREHTKIYDVYCRYVAQNADEVKFISPSSTSFFPALDTYDDNCSYCLIANVLENLCGA